MIEYLEKSLKYIDGYTREEFEKDMNTVNAAVFNISQIGELVKNISDDTEKKYSNIEWNMIKGLRNRMLGIQLIYFFAKITRTVIEMFKIFSVSHKLCLKIFLVML